MIFDLDGVLFRSRRAHKAAYRRVLRSIGITRFDYEEISGMRTKDAFEKVLKSRRLSFSSKDLRGWVKVKSELAYHALQNDPPVYPQCKMILQRLRKAFELSLVSSSSRRNIRLFLQASGTEKLFSVILAGEDAPRAKPSPDLYRLAIRRLKRGPKEAVVIEDAVNGVLAARRARVDVIGMTSDSKRRRLLRQAGAFRVIRRLEELTPYAKNS